MDAAEIFPASDVFFYAAGVGKGSVACFANLFRYEFLLRRGNWWVDTDVCCLSARVPAGPTFYALQTPDEANNAVLRFEPGDAIMRDCAEEARRMGRQVSWGQTGPALLTTTLLRHDLFQTAAPGTRCYPFLWNDVQTLFDPAQAAGLQDLTDGAFCIHLWHEIIRRQQIDKRRPVPPGCYLDSLFTRHAIGFPSSAAYTMAEIRAAFGAPDEAAATEQ